MGYDTAESIHFLIRLRQLLIWLGDCSAPDLIVRTGGEQRLSNFMAWQSCYSELLFIDTFWPAMTRADFESVLSIYAQRKRNFGR